MTEEINNLNTDMKELFVNNKLEELIEQLNQTTDEIILEITLYNYDIIKKYFDTGKYPVLIQHIKFVAFSCFLCEYSAKRNLIDSQGFEDMTGIFNSIYELLKQ
jgi:hypothetical protein